MFKSNYYFYGTHATKARELVKSFDGNDKQLFNRLADVYNLAPIIGFSYGIRAEQEKSDDRANVMAEQVIKIRDSLMFSYRLIMLLDENYESSVEKRIDNAFRFTDMSDANSPLSLNQKCFNEYVLGGVDKLYEKLIEPSTLPDDYMNNLYDFLEVATNRWNLPGASETLDNIIEVAKY